MATKRQRRRRARGAALVEAAVAIPFFIVIFIAMVFFGDLYIEKERTLSESRQKVWTYAMANCEGNQSDIQSNSESVPPESGNNLGEDSKYSSGFKGSDTASKSATTASITVKGEVTTKERQDSGNQSSSLVTVTKVVQSKAYVTCNEKPVDGDDFFGAVKKAWNLISKW